MTINFRPDGSIVGTPDPTEDPWILAGDDVKYSLDGLGYAPWLSIERSGSEIVSIKLDLKHVVQRINDDAAEIKRLRKQCEKFAIQDEYATSRLCSDHRGKWQRGSCALCEIERLQSKLDARTELLRDIREDLHGRRILQISNTVWRRIEEALAMSDEILKALREYDEYAPPTERWQSTGQLIHEAADELERLQSKLGSISSEAQAAADSMRQIEVLSDPRAASLALDEVWNGLTEALKQPGSFLHDEAIGSLEAEEGAHSSDQKICPGCGAEPGEYHQGSCPEATPEDFIPRRRY